MTLTLGLAQFLSLLVHTAHARMGGAALDGYPPSTATAKPAVALDGSPPIPRSAPAKGAAPAPAPAPAQAPAAATSMVARASAPSKGGDPSTAKGGYPSTGLAAALSSMLTGLVLPRAPRDAGQALLTP